MTASIPLLVATITLTSSQVFWSILASIAVLGSIVVGFKYYWNRQHQYYTSTEQLPSATSTTLERKYAPFQAQPHALTIRLLSAVVAIGLVLVVLAWTPLQQHLYAALDTVYLDAEIQTEAPVTTRPLVAPPPPPPMSEPQTIEIVEIEPQPEPPEPEPEPVLPVEPGIGPSTRPISGEVGDPPIPIFIEKPEPKPEPPIDQIVDIADVMPRFPGCEDMDGSDAAKKICADKELTSFIYSHIRYPEQAREIGLEGITVVSFVVGKDGRLRDIKMLRDPGAGLGNETLRVVRLLQKLPQNWTPGKQRGRPVSVRYNLPVKFKLNP